MPKVAIADTDFLVKVREKFKQADEADTAQAERERSDISFENGEQWEADIKLSRQGQQPTNGLPAVPSRPTLVINKIKEPIRQILNQERAADIGVEIVPADDFGDLDVVPDEEEIKLREGLVRRIQRESHASDARTWAFKRAVIAGRGYYLVAVRYLPGKTSDQEVYVHRIYNQEAVKGDPSRVQPDGSDAEYWFIGTWVPFERYKSEYPYLANGKKNPFASSSDTEFMGLTEDYPDWYRAEGDDRAVRVVDHWYIERESRQLVTLSDGTSEWEDELKGVTLADGLTQEDTRTVLDKKIKFCKIGGGCAILEETDWAGPDMPVIQVLGEEVLPYDNQKRSEGMVRPSRDAQQGYNVMVSKQVEMIGLTPLQPMMVDPDAIEDYETEYEQANRRTFFALKYRTYDDQGRELRRPERPNLDPNVLPVSQSIALFDIGIKSTTAVPDPTLGNVDPTLKSARAIKEVTANAAQSTSNFMDNLARSVSYEGKVENNLLYPIYGMKPGRLVRLLTSENTPTMAMIGAPANSPQPQTKNPRVKMTAKLTEDAHFNAIVKVTKAFDSRRTQEASQIADLMSADPRLITWFGDLFFKNSDGPGHAAMAERARIMLDPKIQQMMAAKEQGRVYDPAAQAEIAQLKEQVAHAEAAMQELNQAANKEQMSYKSTVDSEKIKQDAETQRFQIETDKDIKLQEMKDATSIRTAELAAQAKIGPANDANALRAISIQADIEQADTDRMHEARLQEQQHAHEIDKGHQQTAADLTVQAAAPQPEPAAEEPPT